MHDVLMYAMVTVQGWGLNLHSPPGMFQDIARLVRRHTGVQVYSGIYPEHHLKRN